MARVFENLQETFVLSYEDFANYINEFGLKSKLFTTRNNSREFIDNIIIGESITYQRSVESLSAYLHDFLKYILQDKYYLVSNVEGILYDTVKENFDYILDTINKTAEKEKEKYYQEINTLNEKSMNKRRNEVITLEMIDRLSRLISSLEKYIKNNGSANIPSTLLKNFNSLKSTLEHNKNGADYIKKCIDRDLEDLIYSCSDRNFTMYLTINFNDIDVEYLTEEYNKGRIKNKQTKDEIRYLELYKEIKKIDDDKMSSQRLVNEFGNNIKKILGMKYPSKKIDEFFEEGQDFKIDLFMANLIRKKMVTNELFLDEGLSYLKEFINVYMFDYQTKKLDYYDSKAYLSIVYCYNQFLLPENKLDVNDRNNINVIKLSFDLFSTVGESNCSNYISYIGETFNEVHDIDIKNRIDYIKSLNAVSYILGKDRFTGYIGVVLPSGVVVVENLNIDKNDPHHATYIVASLEEFYKLIAYSRLDASKLIKEEEIIGDKALHVDSWAKNVNEKIKVLEKRISSI